MIVRFTAVDYCARTLEVNDKIFHDSRALGGLPIRLNDHIGVGLSCWEPVGTIFLTCSHFFSLFIFMQGSLSFSGPGETLGKPSIICPPEGRMEAIRGEEGQKKQTLCQPKQKHNSKPHVWVVVLSVRTGSC